MNKKFNIIFILIIILCFSSYAQEIKVTVFPDKLHEIDHQVFGHFLERPSWGGECGIEDAVLDDTGELDPRVLEKLKGLDIPVLRFPGGTDVDYMDWTDMIDLPERDDRPVSTGNGGDNVTNRFGFDEFYELIQETNSEAIIPLNFFDAFLKRVPLDSAALHMAGLVAYANAEVGAALPDGIRDWPAVRVANGYEKPHKFKYFQIGNETWALWGWKPELLEQANIEKPYEWYVECVTRYIDLIEAIDPDVEIIADFVNKDLQNMLMESLGDRIDYYVFHIYMPWAMKPDNIKKDGKTISTTQLTRDEVWNAFVSTPNTFNSQYMSSVGNPLLSIARQNDIKIAVTEWNWNGWWQDVPTKPLESNYAQAVGVAGMLHGLARNADVIKIGCQSMLVGSSWGITGIRVDDAEYWPPYYLPTSQMTSFYAQHHGSHLLRSKIENMPTFKQPLKLSGINPKNKVAYVDVLTTGSQDSVSIFFINRDFRNDHKINIDLSAFGITGKAQHVIMNGIVNNSKVNPHKKQPYVFFDENFIDVENGACTITLPMRSVSVLNIPAKHTKVKSSKKQEPKSLELGQNYPNPFNPSTSIEYQLNSTGLTRLDIYDINGRHVKTISNEIKPAGNYIAQWNGQNETGHNVSSGMYITKLCQNDIIETKKLIKIH